MTMELGQALKDSGCYRVSFGVESGVANMRNKVLNKQIRDEHIYQTADILKKVGLPFQTSNMMGFPGERLEDAIQTLEMNIRIGSDIAWTSLYQPYPGTELGEKAVNDGLIDQFPDDETVADAHTDSILQQDEIREIVRLHKFAYIALKHPGWIPLIHKLVRYNFPRLYRLIHRLSYFRYFYCKERILSFPRMISEVISALRYY